MIHNHTPTTSMEKIQSQPKISRKNLRRNCVKFSTKKSAYCQKCAFPTIRRIDTPKAAGIPKSADGMGARSHNRTTISSAHLKRLRPTGFLRFLAKRKRQKSRGSRQDRPHPCLFVPRAPKESTGRAHANRHALCPISFTKRPGQKPSRPPDGNRPA